MQTRITTCARSPLGQWLALAAVTAVLLGFGFYLATDGEVLLKLQNLVGNLTNSERWQQASRDFSNAVREHFRKYDQVQLIAYYGLAIVAGYWGLGIWGRVIRSYRYRFVKGKGLLERQEMWLCMPVWGLAWLVLGGGLFWLVGGIKGLVIGAAVAGLVHGAGWWWKREWVERQLFVPGFKRRVAVGRIKRMEVVAGSEGGTALVVTFRDNWTWTVARGSPKRLQRVGGVVGRVAGLERRDLVTWG